MQKLLFDFVNCIGTDTVWVDHNGENFWYPKVTMKSSFKADVTDFPFDNQRFIFHFGSWSAGENQLRIEKNDKSMIDAHYLEDAEWELVSSKKQTIKTKYDSDIYSEIMFTYIVSRKPGKWEAVFTLGCKVYPNQVPCVSSSPVCLLDCLVTITHTEYPFTCPYG